MAMEGMFTEMQGCLKDWEGLGLTDDDLCELEGHLLKNPEAGVVMPGAGGLRKQKEELTDREKAEMRKLVKHIIAEER